MFAGGEKRGSKTRRYMCAIHIIYIYMLDLMLTIHSLRIFGVYDFFDFRFMFRVHAQKANMTKCGLIL